LPSSVTSPDDLQDAAALCAMLKMEHRTVSIEPMLHAFRMMPGFTESPYLLGNLMARIRMVVLYYHANCEQRLVCGTSNRSEYLLGYCTKFGDNAADIQPLIHLYKTDVYKVARVIGIPERIYKKAPSAGLWAGQSDEQEIGLPYTEIDASLKRFEAHGWKAATPSDEKVLARVQKNAHKRLPAPSLSAGPKGPE
jgi:NAD+ synthase